MFAFFFFCFYGHLPFTDLLATYSLYLIGISRGLSFVRINKSKKSKAAHIILVKSLVFCVCLNGFMRKAYERNSLFLSLYISFFVYIFQFLSYTQTK